MLGSLDRMPLDRWATLRDALPQRFQNALVEATQLLQPKAVAVALPRATLTSEAELDAWLARVREEVLKRLPEGPVII